PINWSGPRLDSLETAKEGSSRVVTQVIASLVFKEPIVLVDGGQQSRSFTYSDDGIEALMRIIRNDGGKASGQIFNIGNPANNCTIRDLAGKLLELFRNHPAHREDKKFSEIIVQDAESFYGESYQDIQTRVPSIERARKILGWEPQVALDDALQKTLDAFLEEL
ncbi:NAD-dependent epimerase/dehydratase family protein, partial [bacterium]|nr:NAD-dependent epimerase/dehydratase family protein [bacterium]